MDMGVATAIHEEGVLRCSPYPSGIISVALADIHLSTRKRWKESLHPPTGVTLRVKLTYLFTVLMV